MADTLTTNRRLSFDAPSFNTGINLELMTNGARALIAKTSASSGVEISSIFCVHELSRRRSSCSLKSALPSVFPAGKAASSRTSSPGATQSNARNAGSDVVGALAVQDRINDTSAVGSFASAIAGPSSNGKDALPMALRNLASRATVWA